MPMKRTRRHFTPEQKAAILREHLVDGVAVSELCDRHGLQPTLYYRWQKEAFEALPGFFEGGRKEAGSRALARENEQLKRKLEEKNEVIAEVAAELVAEKKSRGGRS